MIRLKKILPGWIIRTGKIESEVIKDVSLYNESSHFQNILITKALFLTWIRLNYVIISLLAIFLFFWKETLYKTLCVFVLSGYFFFVILITLLTGSFYAILQNSYKNNLPKENKNQAHS